MKSFIGPALLAGVVIAACLLFFVAGPRPDDPEGFRARVRGVLGMRDNRIPRCHGNLVQLELFKDQWASENRKSTNDTPTWDELRPSFPDRWSNSIPVCPAGGTYTLGRVGEKPRCSVGGGYRHALLP